MADLPNRRDLFATGRRSITTTPNLRINAKVIDVEGSDVNVLLGAMSLMGEEAVAAFAACYRALYVLTAEGHALDRVAFDRYQLTRFPAVPANVSLTVSRPAATGAVTYPAGARVQTVAGTQFATDADAVFAASDLTKTVTATALVAGVDGNVKAATLTQFVDVPLDSTLTVTNPAGAAGGAEQESDIDFRARILDFFPTVRRGTIGAIEFGGRQVAGVAVTKAIEVANLCAGVSLPAGMVQLIVADKSGGFSAAMLQQVRDQLLTHRAAGIPVEVSGGVPVFQPVTWDVDFLAGVDQQRAREELRAITVAVAQFLRPGETLRRAGLIAGAAAVPGVVVAANSLVVPVGDTVATTTQILRIKPEEVSFI